MNTQTRKGAQYISLAAALCLLAAGLWLAAPALAGSPPAQTPPVAPVAPAPPAAAVAPAPPAPPAPGWPGEEGSHTSYLGIDVRDVTPDSAKQLKLREERGAEIVMVDQDAPAGKAGFKEHDVILDFDGQKVEGVQQLRRMIHETPPGRTVTIGYSRDGKLNSAKVQLADRSQAMGKSWSMPAVTVPDINVQMPHIEVPAIQITTMSRSRAGLLVSNLTPQLGEYFGCKNGEGVLVQSVEKGSPAEVAGFKAGDVIVKVDDQHITDLSDWRSALRARKSGKLNVGIIRDHKDQTLTLTLPAGRESGDAFQLEMPDFHLDLQAMESALEEAQRSARCAQHAATVQVQAEMRQHGKAMKQLQREMQQREKELRKQMEKLRDLNLTIEED